MPFTFNKVYLDSETTAEQLRSTRQAKNIKIETVAKKLNINLKYLKALESGRYDKLPPGAYSKNFLREYCLFLGLNYNETLKLFEHEIAVGPKKTQSVFSSQIVKKQYLWAMPKYIRNILMVLLIGICLFYLNFYIRNINAKPKLEINNPPENLVTADKNIEIIGLADTGALIRINGEEVLADTNGLFNKNINLNKGINIIKITAQRKLGPISEITRQVLVKDGDNKEY